MRSQLNARVVRRTPQLSRSLHVFSATPSPSPGTRPVGFARATLRWWRVSPVSAVLAAANLVGVALYVWRASYGWVIPEERAAGINSVTAEPFIWALAIAPVVAFFGLVNVCWGIAVLTSRRPDARLMLAVGAIWVAGVVVDFMHH